MKRQTKYLRDSHYLSSGGGEKGDWEDLGGSRGFRGKKGGERGLGGFGGITWFQGKGGGSSRL